MSVTMQLNLDSFEFELADSQVIDELVSKKKLKVTMLDHYGRLYEGDLAEAFSSDDLTTRDLVPGNLYYETEGKRLILPYELLKKMDKHYVHLAAAVDAEAFVAFLKQADQEIILSCKL